MQFQNLLIGLNAMGDASKKIAQSFNKHNFKEFTYHALTAEQLQYRALQHILQTINALVQP